MMSLIKCMEKRMEKVASNTIKTKEAKSNLRYERKFVYTNCDAEDIIRRVYLHPFGFKEVFHKRKINNIYFDDSNYNFYKQNVEGVADRKKIRLRWYGYHTATIKSPTIEIKKKMGEAGDKNSTKLKDVSFDLNQYKINAILTGLIENTTELMGLNCSLKNLHPTLINSYERRYFLSLCSRYRITVDYNQSFFNPNYQNYKRSELTLNDVVLELKYNLDDDDDARQVSQLINARLSKNSKYVTGINMLYHPALS